MYILPNDSLNRLPNEIIAWNILRFLSFHEVIHIRILFEDIIQSASIWCNLLDTISEDWDILEYRKLFLRLLPNVRKLHIRGLLNITHDILQNFREYQCEFLFGSLEKLDDAGNLLELFQLIWPKLYFPQLVELKLTYTDITTPRYVGNLVSSCTMPELKILNILWGIPILSNMKSPLILSELHMPRGWSLSEAVHHLQSLPEGSKIRLLSVTHCFSDTLVEDIYKMKDIFVYEPFKIHIYHIHIQLPVTQQFWKFIQSGMIEFQTCSILLENHIYTSYMMDQIHLPLLKRFELNNFYPELHQHMFFILNFKQTPKLIFLRGDHSLDDHITIAKLFLKHQSFQNQFHLAFDVYEDHLKKQIQLVWSQYCPSAVVI